MSNEMHGATRITDFLLAAAGIDEAPRDFGRRFSELRHAYEQIRTANIEFFKQLPVMPANATATPFLDALQIMNSGHPITRRAITRFNGRVRGKGK